MEHKEEKLKTFVPALALEHPMNDEHTSKKTKVVNALRRLVVYGDFFVDDIPADPPPFVILENMKFHPHAMGYEVEATVRSG